MVLEQISGQFSNAISAGGSYTTYAAIIILVLLFFLGVVYYVMNKRSYNVNVIICRPIQGTGAFHLESGFLGKHTLNKNKELRFKIYNAQKYKLQYNEEPIDQQYFVKRMFKGRYMNTVFLAPNTEGWLQPIFMRFDNMEGITATVTNADLTYYQSELALMDMYFNDKDFFQKYGMFILVLLSIINSCVLIYAIYKLGGVAEAFNHAADGLANLASAISNNATTTTPGVIKIG